MEALSDCLGYGAEKASDRAKAEGQAKVEAFKIKYHVRLALLWTTAVLGVMGATVLVVQDEPEGESEEEDFLTRFTLVYGIGVFFIEQLTERVSYVIDTNAPKYLKSVGGVMTQSRNVGLYTPLWFITASLCHWTMLFGVFLEVFAWGLLLSMGWCHDFIHEFIFDEAFAESEYSDSDEKKLQAFVTIFFSTAGALLVYVLVAYGYCRKVAIKTEYTKPDDVPKWMNFVDKTVEGLQSLYSFFAMAVAANSLRSESFTSITLILLPVTYSATLKSILAFMTKEKLSLKIPNTGKNGLVEALKHAMCMEAVSSVKMKLISIVYLFIRSMQPLGQYVATLDADTGETASRRVSEDVKNKSISYSPFIQVAVLVVISLLCNLSGTLWIIRLKGSWADVRASVDDLQVDTFHEATDRHAGLPSINPDRTALRADPKASVSQRDHNGTVRLVQTVNVEVVDDSRAKQCGVCQLHVRLGSSTKALFFRLCSAGLRASWNKADIFDADLEDSSRLYKRKRLQACTACKMIAESSILAIDAGDETTGGSDSATEAVDGAANVKADIGMVNRDGKFGKPGGLGEAEAGTNYPAALAGGAHSSAAPTELLKCGSCEVRVRIGASDQVFQIDLDCGTVGTIQQATVFLTPSGGPEGAARIEELVCPSCQAKRAEEERKRMEEEAKRVQEQIRELLCREQITFEGGKAELTKDGERICLQIAEKLKQLPSGATIEVHGHTHCNPPHTESCSGTTLSRNRCDTVIEKLRNLSVSADFKVTAWGCREPSVGSQKLVRFFIK